MGWVKKDQQENHYILVINLCQPHPQVSSRGRLQGSQDEVAWGFQCCYFAALQEKFYSLSGVMGWNVEVPNNIHYILPQGCHPQVLIYFLHWTCDVGWVSHATRGYLDFITSGVFSLTEIVLWCTRCELPSQLFLLFSSSGPWKHLEPYTAEILLNMLTEPLYFIAISFQFNLPSICDPFVIYLPWRNDSRRELVWLPDCQTSMWVWNYSPNYSYFGELSTMSLQDLSLAGPSSCIGRENEHMEDPGCESLMANHTGTIPPEFANLIFVSGFLYSITN